MKRTQTLRLYFVSIYGDFGHAAIDSPESVAENPKTMLLTVDLWPDLDLARDLFKNILSTD